MVIGYYFEKIMSNYYETLGVSKSATNDEIKQAYRKMALKYHPDRGGDADSEKKFKEANEAYQVLSDPQKRSTYDQFGDNAFRQGGFNSANNAGQGFGGGFEGFDFSGFGSRGGQSSGFGFGGGLNDIFEDFFGSAFSQVQAELKITPAQAVLGDKINIQVGNEKLEFDLPSGTQDGTSYRFAGKGNAYKGSKKGDLILTIKIEMPKHISHEQKELWEQLREAEKNKKKWWGA